MQSARIGAASQARRLRVVRATTSSQEQPFRRRTQQITLACEPLTFLCELAQTYSFATCGSFHTSAAVRTSFLVSVLFAEL